jgi:uncharacterized protein YggU (UPF0235/DUF167 family)
MHIKVTVFPEAGNDFVEKVTEDTFRVFVMARAKENMANKAAIILLSKYLGKGIKLVSGGMKTHKIFEVL